MSKSMSNGTIQTLQSEVEVVVSDSSKGQLEQCARLLATYVALYKHQFGELTVRQYESLSSEIASSIDFGESLYVGGLQEFLDTLLLVEVQADDGPGSSSANRILN